MLGLAACSIGLFFCIGFILLNMTKISFFKHCKLSKPTGTIEINQYFENIKSGLWQDSVLNYRAGKSPKEKIPACTISGLFDNERKAEQLTKHSGYICIDCDSKDNEDLLLKREQLGCDPRIYAFHISVGGKGLAIYFKINPSKHFDSFQAIEKYLADEYKIIIDASGKDISRLRFVSFDPEIFINNNAEKWVSYLKKEQIAPISFNPVYAKNDINYCIDQLLEKRIDITQSYKDWVSICLGLIHEFGEAGRALFHSVSSLNADYKHEESEKLFNKLVNHSPNGRITTIATFFYHCKQAGINIKSERTQKIESISRIRRKEIGKNGGQKDEIAAKISTIEYLKKIEGIQDAEDIIEKVFALDNKQFKESEENENAQLYDYINSLDAKFNLITQRVEIKGNDLRDNDLNSIYLNCRDLFPKLKISRDLISAILESDRVKSYNPFLDFIEKNKHLKPSGKILDLLDSLIIPNDLQSQKTAKFINNWLVSIMASIHGTYSLLILVLIGEQATNKTNFFRNLLPLELQRYYTESKLDEGKDSEILMSQKLIIVDDEFSGKSKKEAEKLKDIVSKQTITHRKAYGRYSEDMNRIAVMGGTSNSKEIINDPTGNRRIIPIQIMDVDMKKYFAVDKTDLFMELFWKWKLEGNSWMLTKADIKNLNDNTSDYYETSIEEETILKYFKPSNKNEFGACYMSTTEILNFCEGQLVKQRLNIKKVGQILKKNGFERTSFNHIKVYWVIKLFNEL